MTAPNLYREDVRVLHGVYCRRDEMDCICHHAVWHSCPDAKRGASMFKKLPSRPAEADTLGAILAELQAIRALLGRDA